MRASFNTTVDLYTGPNAAIPNAYIRTADCRYVLASYMFDYGLPYSGNAELYVTLEGTPPTLPEIVASVGGIVSWDFGKADVLYLFGVPTIPLIAFLNTYVSVPGRDPYWQCRVIIGPYP